MMQHRAVPSQGTAKRWSVQQFGQIVDYQMSAMMLQFLRIPLACDTDHKSEASTSAGLDSGDGVLNDDGPFWFTPQQLCRHQERIGCGLPGKTLRMDRVAIDLHLEEVV